MKKSRIIISLALLLFVAACGSSGGGKYPMGYQFNPEENLKISKVGKPYTIKGQKYYPTINNAYSEEGMASWYGPNFHAKSTANGETFDKYDMTAAHKTLPMPSIVRVTNLENNKSVAVRVNDRGPFVPGRIIDVSKKAAERLGFISQGTAKVKVDYLPEETALLFPAGKNPYESFNNRASYAMLNRGPVASGTPVPDTVSDETDVKQTAELYNQQQEMKQLPSFSQGNFGRTTTAQSPYPFKVGQSFSDDKSNIRSYYIEIGSFNARYDAENAAKRLINIGKVDVIPANLHGRKVYGVKIGPFVSNKTADQKLDAVINNYGFKDAFIIGN